MDTNTARCEFCLAPLGPPARRGGRQRRFCSGAHRAKAARRLGKLGRVALAAVPDPPDDQHADFLRRERLELLAKAKAGKSPELVRRILNDLERAQPTQRVVTLLEAGGDPILAALGDAN